MDAPGASDSPYTPDLVADLPIDLAPDLSDRLARAFDTEGKILRAFEALGPIGGADVLLVGGDGLRAQQLRDLGARLTVVETGGTDPLASVRCESSDVIVTCWSWFRDDLASDLVSAERVLRPAGRLLVLHNYGRDDVSRLRPSDLPEYTTWSRRDGWFLRTGFKMRVIHCWWTFSSMDEMQSFLAGAFGVQGTAVATTLKRPRLSYNVAIYHRTRGEVAETAGRPRG